MPLDISEGIFRRNKTFTTRSLKTKINIQTLAKELNVSTSTVSKALNDSHEISDETKRRVLELATKYQYSPNPHASGLRNNKSKTIAVVIPEVGNSFFASVIKGIESVARVQGYHVLIYLSNESFEKERMILESLQLGRIDGLLMSLALETQEFSHIQNLLSQDIPLVFFDRVPQEIQAHKVVTNEFELGYKAVQHLWESGCRQIGYLLNGTSNSTLNLRQQGFLKALSEKNITNPETHIVEIPKGISDDTFFRLLQDKSFDGVIASVEELVTPLWSACKSGALAIAQELKVLSFCDFPLATVLSPTLTTVKHPATEMGKKATELLIAQIEKPRKTLSFQSIMLQSEIIPRESTLALSKTIS